MTDTFDNNIKLKIIVLMGICGALVGFSSFCAGNGWYYITPIYVLLIQALFGIHPILFFLTTGIIVWLMLGIFLPQNTSRVVTALNVLLTLVGLWWLIESKETAIQYTSTSFYLASLVIFTVVQILCFYWGLRLKSTSNFKYHRMIATLFITLHLSWSFMTSFGIH